MTERHNSYKELKNMIHNEMNISKDGIREMIQTAVTNEAKWLSQRLITPELLTVATKEVIRQMVHDSIYTASKNGDNIRFGISENTLLGQVKKEITDQTKNRMDIRIYDRKRDSIKAVVISAFPGTGKSHAYRTYRNSLKIHDSDSSKFSWITDNHGHKVRNPDFPNNYIRHIHSKLYTSDYILVSSHLEVREAMAEAGIDYIVVAPRISDRDKFIERYKNRGSDDAFIDMMRNKWSEFVTSLKTDVFSKRHITATDFYITDIIESNEVTKTHGFLHSNINKEMML